MKNLYLDIDGVLLTAKHTQAAPGVDEFVDFVTQHFMCYWLTTHCKGDSAPALRYLSGFLKPATVEKLHQAVRPTNWDTLKTEAIDLTSDFYWLDDSPFQAEIAYLKIHKRADRLVIINLNQAGALTIIKDKLAQLLLSTPNYGKFKIHKRIIYHEEAAKYHDFLSKALFITLAIVCIPLILVALAAMTLSNTLTANQSQESQSIDDWFDIPLPPSFGLILSYKSIAAASISDAAAGHFDTEALRLYKAEPYAAFFAGYFTSFKVEATDGIFLQKVYFDDKLKEVVSSPLYFFSYWTGTAEEIHDFKDYVLLDTKGNSTDFLLTASGEQHDLEVSISRL
jgi:hypothetical protein